MEIIKLKNNPYHHLKILSTRKVKTSHGNSYTEITYWKKDPLLLRITSTAFLIILGLGSFGLLFLSVDFCSMLSDAAKGCFLDPMKKRRYIVYSKISLEDHLWNRVQASKEANNLYQKALITQEQPISLELKPYGKLKTNGGIPWEAHFNPHKTCVCLALNRTEDQLLSILVFELGNAAQGKEFQRIRQGKISGAISSADTFAKEMERIEYKAAKMHNRVIQKAIKENQWSSSMIRYSGLLATFEEEWKEEKGGEHAEHYRREFNTYQKQVAQRTNRGAIASTIQPQLHT